MTLTNGFTAWACETCYLTHHGYSLDELGETPDETPLGLLEVGTVVTDGLVADERERREQVREFDTAPCDGCASRLAGTRHALTFWSLA